MMSMFSGDGGDFAWLDAMNASLASLEREMVDAFDAPKQPILFIVGPPRSGTTLLTQLLAKHIEIGYINNVAARLWNAPYLGVRLAQTLAGNDVSATELSSKYGNSPGYEGPHEFGHFWQRWFDYEETHCISDEQLAKVDIGFLKKELAAIESVFKRPTMYKNLAACGMQLEFLANILPQSIFIRLRRDPYRVACSLLNARQSRNGDKQRWFSVRPTEYADLKDLNFPEQIAGQIDCIEQHLTRALEGCPKNRKLEIDYTDLVASPETIIEGIADLIARVGGVAYRRPVEMTALAEPEPPTLDAEDQELLHRACDQRFKKAGQLT